MQKNIEIPLNKGKLALLLIGSIVFIVISIWLFNFAGSQEECSPTFMKSIGGIGFVFFGIAGAFIGKKLMDKDPGLVINNQGIIENTNGLSMRLIEWKDILGFDILEIHRQKLILIKVRKPQKYIDKASNNAQKRLLRLNLTEYGTPIHIGTNSLKMGFEELLELLNAEHKKRKK